MSDRSLLEPNDEHQQAALVDNEAPFTPPVSALIELGEALRDDQEERIAALGLSQEHVPDLVRLVLDRELNEDAGDDEMWGPVNALLALKGLDVSAELPRLVPALDIDNDWIGEELPGILASVGEPAIAPLRSYLLDQSRWVFGRSAAASALVKAAQQHPELREEAVSAITQALEQFAINDPELNGFLVADLAGELQVAEALPLIRRAFEANRVDESIMGDWLDVLDELDLEPDPDDPLVALSNQRRRVMSQRAMATLPDIARPPRPQHAPARKSDAARKRKNKRKAEAASRKANKKRKKK